MLVTTLDRAFRSAKDTYDAPAYMDAYNVAFVAATYPIDTTTSTGKLRLGVLAAVAEFEIALIVECTKEGPAEGQDGDAFNRIPASLLPSFCTLCWRVGNIW